MPTAGQAHHEREPEKGVYYTQAVRASDTLHVSGCESREADGSVIGRDDMTVQVHPVHTDLTQTLAAHGATFVHVEKEKESVFTTGMEALEARNDVRIGCYVADGSAPPASTWIECTSLAMPGLMLAVECIAVLGAR